MTNTGWERKLPERRSMNALTLVFAAMCLFAIGYRVYGVFIANKVLELNSRRNTPSVTVADGVDYVETNK
jgi:carbon starvation protein